MRSSTCYLPDWILPSIHWVLTVTQLQLRFTVYLCRCPGYTYSSTTQLDSALYTHFAVAIFFVYWIRSTPHVLHTVYVWLVTYVLVLPHDHTLPHHRHCTRSARLWILYGSTFTARLVLYFAYVPRLRYAWFDVALQLPPRCRSRVCAHFGSLDSGYCCARTHTGWFTARSTCTHTG